MSLFNCKYVNHRGWKRGKGGIPRASVTWTDKIMFSIAIFQIKLEEMCSIGIFYWSDGILK